MPKRMYDMFELKPFNSRSFGVRLVDSSYRNLWGRSTMLLVITNILNNIIPDKYHIFNNNCYNYV